jgi:hypothetical protein
VHACILDNTGTCGSEFGVATDTINEQHPTVAACSQADQYLFAWQRQNPGNLSDDDIWGRMMSGAGVLSPTTPIAGTTTLQQYPRVSCNSAGNEYLLVWQDQYGAGFYPYFGISAEFIDTAFNVKPDFGVVGPGWVYNSPDFGTNRLYPAVAYGTTTAVVAWQHTRDDTNGYKDIWARAVWPNAFSLYLPLVRR